VTQTPSHNARRWIAPVIVAVTVVAFLLVGAYYAGGLTGCSTTCHKQDAFVAATAASSHASVRCAACHASSGGGDALAFRLRHLPRAIAPSLFASQRDLSAVPDERCLRCHEKIDEEIVTSNGIRIDHANCAQGSACTDCHSTVAHGTQTGWVRVYDMDTCLECHTKVASSECGLCHEGRATRERIKSGTFAVTHGPNWEKTHGMGDAHTCSACHTATTCEKCHGPGLPHDARFLETHATVARDPRAKCSSCHEQSFCEACHGLRMPHPQKFVESHSAAAKADEALCKRCHVESDCVTCHVKHVHPGGAIGSLSKPGGGQ